MGQKAQLAHVPVARKEGSLGSNCKSFYMYWKMNMKIKGLGKVNSMAAVLQRPRLFECKPSSGSRCILGRRTAARSKAYIVCEAGTASQPKKRQSKTEKIPPLPNVRTKYCVPWPFPSPITYPLTLRNPPLFSTFLKLHSQPQEHQQTVQRSFTLGGVGLHTGEYAFVRVRPALTGEGRYFVRVSPGTNADDYRLEEPSLVTDAQLDINAWPDDGLDKESRATLFLRYLEEQEQGYQGEFGEFVQQETDKPQDTFFMDVSTGPPEDAVPRDEMDRSVAATVDYASVYRGAAVVLNGDQVRVLSPEALLSALEACGVDNARIEIEGGGDDVSTLDDRGSVMPPTLEVPVVDGSALGWVLEIQKAGVKESTGGGVPRMAPAPQEPLTVQDGDAFVAFFPCPTARVTAGVDYGPKGVVGRQWFTWSPADSSELDQLGHPDHHYRWDVAPARIVIPSAAAVQEMLDIGLLQAGPDGCCLVADDGDLLENSWSDPSLERFPGEEAARKAVADLLGNLALGAPAGGRGLPVGHVVAYNASPELQLQFIRELQEKSKRWGYAAVVD